MSLVIQLALLVGCGAQKRAELEYDLAATRAALDTTLEVDAGDGVVYVDDQGGAVDPADLEALGSTEPEPEVAEDAPEDVVEVIPQDDPEPTPIEPAPESGGSGPYGELDAMVDTYAVSPGAASPELAASIDNLARSVDELRMMQTMEARLLDKQRQIDHLYYAQYGVHPSGGHVTVVNPEAPAPKDPEMEARLKTLEEAEARRAKEAEEAAQAPQPDPEVVAEANAELEAERAAMAKEREEQALKLAELEADLAKANASNASLQGDLRDLAAENKDLQDTRKDERKATSFDQRTQRREERRERIRWFLTRRDANKRWKHEQKMELERYDDEYAALQAAKQKEDAEAYAAALAELDAEKARLVEERSLLDSEKAALEDEKAGLMAEQAALETQRANLESHLEALEAAEAELGELTDEQEAERAKAEAQLEELQAKEAQLRQAEEELANLRAKEAELAEANAELDELRGVAQQAAGLEAQLAEIERRETAKQEQLASALQPLTEQGVEVEVNGSQAVVHLPSDILFASGSARLSKDGKAAAASLGDLLADMDGVTVQVRGHTDNVPVGGSAYKDNWELAYARASVVLDAMVNAGVPADRVSAASFGDTRPVATNLTVEGRAQNRRIEIILDLE